MENNGKIKINGIRQIVRLKELLHKWQNVTRDRKKNRQGSNKNRPVGVISPATTLRGSDVCSDDSDEDSCRSLEQPRDIPRGYLAVCVGPEHERFIIPTIYLGDPLFKNLLEKAEEEYGFDHSGGALTIPCEIETFRYLLKLMENHQSNQVDE